MKKTYTKPSTLELLLATGSALLAASGAVGVRVFEDDADEELDVL